jgi:agmatinase
MPTADQMIGFGYEGVASFCRFPVCFALEELEADVAVLGACLDTGTTNRSGTRHGPRAIREASMIYSMGFDPEKGFYDVERGEHLLKGVRIVDCGDIPTLPTLTEDTFEFITQAIQAVRERGAVPLLLGGDHSISFPAVRGFEGTSLHVIQFDTHLDYMDEEFGMRLSHASPMKRISELDHVTGLSHIGIRGLLNLPGWVEEASQGKSRFHTADEVHEKGVDFIATQIPEAEHYYITLDIDALDPSEAPGTGTPEPGGLSYRQLRALLKAILSRGKLAGMDLVEVNPLFDSTGRTAQLAARLIIDALGAATLGPGKA